MSGMRRVRRRAFSFSPFPKKGKGVRRAIQKKQAKRQPPAGTPPKTLRKGSPPENPQFAKNNAGKALEEPLSKGSTQNLKSAQNAEKALNKAILSAPPPKSPPPGRQKAGKSPEKFPVFLCIDIYFYFLLCYND